MNTIPDDIDLSEYLRAPDDLRVIVRPASSYAEQLHAEFAGRDEERYPSMFSTKLRELLQFRPGEVTVWAGYNGHRKSMFTGQVALDLMVQKEPVLVASFEMAPARTLARMARQAWGSEAPTRAALERFLAWAERLWIADHKGTISPERCTALCRYFAEEHRGKHAFVDSMMMVCSSEEHLDQQKQFMTGIVRMAIETGLHVHLVAHCRKPSDESRPPSKYDLRGSAAISDQADNVVMVWSDQQKKAAQTKDRTKPDGLISVEKQRNGAWEGKAAVWFDEPSLRFTDGDGTIVEPYAGLRA